MTDAIRIPLTGLYLAWLLISFLMLWGSFWFIGTHWDTDRQQFRKEGGKPYKHQLFVDFVVPVAFAFGVVGMAASIGLLGVYAFFWSYLLQAIDFALNAISSGIPKIEFV
jgi:hypothetical protein